MKGSTKSTILKVLGVLFVLSAVAFIFIGIGMYISPTETSTSADGALIGGVCTPIFLIPGAVFLYFATKITKKNEALTDVAGYLRMYRRITLSEVSRKVGKSEKETMRLINECIEKGMVKGHIDRQTKEFFTNSSLKQENRIVGINECTHCGASVDKKVLRGETVRCEYCGGVINEPPKMNDRRKMGRNKYYN